MKTTVDIDKDLAAEAAEILGTTTLKDTVDAALREAVRMWHVRRLAERVRTGTLPVPTLEELERSKAPKLPVGALSKSRRRTA